MQKRKSQGFTLIELLVVIAIIGLLASVVLLALNSARQKSRDAKRLADVRQMASALELYFNDNNSYPTTPNSTINGNTLPWGSPAISPTYVGLLPSAPLPADSPCTTNNSYVYAGAASSYTLSFCIGGQTGGYGAGPHTLSQAGIQ